jgi:hypothetical protein
MSSAIYLGEGNRTFVHGSALGLGFRACRVLNYMVYSVVRHERSCCISE